MKTLLMLSLLSPTLFAASYSVPVPEALVNFAHYTNTVAVGAMKDGVLTVDYDLPATLVGKNQPGLTFTGKAAGKFVPVAGKNVNGVCMRASNRLTCLLRYPGLKIDAVTRDEAIQETFDKETIAMRMEVGRFFGNDPAGILYLDLN